MTGSWTVITVEFTVVVIPWTDKLPITFKSSPIVTVDIVEPSLIGTLSVDVPINIPLVVSFVFILIWFVPATSKLPVGLSVPIPTLPSTIKPLTGANCDPPE